MKLIQIIINLQLLLLCLCISGCNKNEGTNKDVVEPDNEALVETDSEFDLSIDDMSIRDPFIFVDNENQVYYLHAKEYKDGGNKIKAYKSKDLQKWKDIGYSFLPDVNFWGTKDFWAPDLYKYKGKYYLFVTFSSDTRKRGTSILVADKPEGPFQPLINDAVTPEKWMCLDGALYIDKEEKPWMIYCHEWVEVGDGEVVAQRLSDDLTQTVGDPQILFSASKGPWVGSGITDAPFIYELDNNKLVMLWSSVAKNGKYSIGLARSESGSLLGPWVHRSAALNEDDGGHAMLFNNFEGQLMISYHSPNRGATRPIIHAFYLGFLEN